LTDPSSFAGSSAPRPRLLIISNDIIDESLAGPGMRNLELSRALAGQVQVSLATPGQSRLTVEGVRLVSYSPQRPSELRALAEASDVVLFSSFILDQFPFLETIPGRRVIDLYDPTLLENLHYYAAEPADAQQAIHRQTLAMTSRLARIGDFFLSGNERQRDFWLGFLAANGRVNPLTFQTDDSLRALIDVVGIGFPDRPLRRSSPGLRGVHPAIPSDAQIVLWGGGIWNWLDPLTLIRAWPQVIQSHPNARLVFLGTRHPNPDVPVHEMAGQAQTLAAELGEKDRSIVFIEWVPYAEREALLAESAVGVALHPVHIETRYSIRTRVLDYIWARLPVLVTDGDVTSEWVRQYGIGRVIPPFEPGAAARALIDLLDRPKTDFAPAFEPLLEQYRWERVAAPLLRFCLTGRPAPDRDLARASAGASGQTISSGLARAGYIWRKEGAAALLRRSWRRLQRETAVRLDEISAPLPKAAPAVQRIRRGLRRAAGLPVAGALPVLPPPESYTEWIARTEAVLLNAAQVDSPRFQVVLLGGSAAERQQTEIALRGQTCPNWGIASEDRLNGRAAAPASDTALVFIVPGCQPAPFALAQVAAALAHDPHPAVVYGDHDHIDPDLTRHSPRFKPGFSPDALLGCNDLAPFIAVQAEAFDRLGGLNPAMGSARVWDLWLRLLEAGERFERIPHILSHQAGTQPAEAGADGLRAVQAHLERSQPGCFRAEAAPGGRVRLRRAPDRKGHKVSIIIPSRGAPPELETCLRSLFEKTRYPAYEVIVVNNGPKRPEAIPAYAHWVASLASLSQTDQDEVGATMRVVHDDSPTFNYSAANNFGARCANGELLLFLNNDTRITDSDWLEELALWAERPQIGVVGARLLRPDGTIQHAGVTVGLTGFAGHLFGGLPNSADTIFGGPDGYRNVSAVTGACLMIRRELFERLGGFNERLSLCGNDVELCLRVQQAGLRVLVNGYARLIHLEGASRGGTVPDGDYVESYCPYRALLESGDPYFHPGLSYWRLEPSLRGADEPEPLHFVQQFLRSLGGVPPCL
jgi:GT2 family glycosyltransferase/glycosyltransferase involved in cell wall biosynthesis